MAISAANRLLEPIEIIKTAGTASNIAIIVESGVPDGNTAPQSDAVKGSIYIQDDATDDESPFWLKVDEAGADDDWVQCLIGKDEGTHDIEAGWTWITDNKIFFRDSAIFIHSNADGEMTIQADTQINIGDGTNQVEIQTDGEIQLAGTARVTRVIDLPPGSWTDGGTAPDKTNTGDYPGESYDIGDSSLMSFMVPTDADLSGDLTVRAYWYIDEAYATGSGEVQWACAYSAAPVDESEAVDGAGYTGDLDPGDQNIPATAKYLTYTGIGTLAGGSLAAGDIVGLELSRVAVDDGSAPTADPVITLVQIRYTANKLGVAT